MVLIRRLHGMDKAEWSTPRLADRFRISPEAVSKILKSPWRNEDEVEEERIAAQLEEEVRMDEERTLDTPHMRGRQQQEYKPDRQLFPPSSVSRTRLPDDGRKVIPLQAGFSIDRNSKNYKWGQRM